MASIQCEKEEVQLSFEQYASLEEIIKEADNSYDYEQCVGVVAKNEGHDDMHLVGAAGGGHAAAARFRITAVAGGLTNQTKGPLSIMHKHKYAGHVVSDFPDPLKSTGTFAMSAMTDKGCKSAVVYSGKNKAGVECGWLLAFADTKATKRRVYAECGPKSKFNKVDWAKVEQNLNKAGENANASCKETGTSIYATIKGTTSKSVVAAGYLG